MIYTGAVPDLIMIYTGAVPDRVITYIEAVPELETGIHMVFCYRGD